MPHDLIPVPRREAVSRALIAVLGSDAVGDLTLMRAGLSGALVCRVVVGGEAALLRVQMRRDALRDPVRLQTCMNAAAAAGLAPAVRYGDTAAGVTVTDFIAAQPLSAYPGGMPAVVMALGGMVAKLQATPVFPRFVDFFEGMEGVIGNALATGILSEDVARAPLAAYRAICAAYPRLPPEAWVSSHNDLNPSNIVCDGQRLWLVDWEAAFAADPHVDPAILANWFGLQGEGEAAFLGVVFGAVDDERRARFALMRRVCQMFVACLMLGLAGAGRAAPVKDLEGPALTEVRRGLAAGTVQLNTAEGQLLLAKAHLRELATFRDTPTFAAAAATLEAL
jgi:hypothetical protein